MASAVNLSELEYADQQHIKAARVDADSFMEYVLRDEETGGIVEQSEPHSDWQHLADQHPKLLIWSHVESGKTQQMAIGRTLFELGRNKNLRVAIVSNTQDQAGKVVAAIAKYIEQSEDLHRVFPELEKGETWTQYRLTVKRSVVSKDPSVQAFGLHGAVLGARIDLLILDDILDYENTRTPAMRDDCWNWIHATLIGRMTRNSKMRIIGTAFHPEDTLHRFAKSPGWHAVRFPVIDEETGESNWPDRWPMSRINERRTEMPPIEFARQMLCVARDDSVARFKQDWIDIGLRRGNGKQPCYALERVPSRCRVYTGVDLAVQRHSAADDTVLFTGLIHPNGDREVLNIESGKWSGPDIVQKIIDTSRRYQSIAVVENNAAQDYIVQFARGEDAVPIIPFTTGRNKAHPEFGIESIAAEMAGGKWIIPNDNGKLHPEIRSWIEEMLYYDPTAHTGDRLMASWFMREGAGQKKKTVQYGNLDLMSR